MERILHLMVLIILHMIDGISGKSLRNITTDQAALSSLKSYITPYHILESNWTTSTSVCDWVGVTCSLRHHRVARLNISGMNFTGILPPQFGDLSFLTFLDLRYNNFHGNIPNELGNLHRLRVLLLDYNKFNGKIPPLLGSLSELRWLSLGNNNFSGLIPPSISNLSKLEGLLLSYNCLQGNIPIGIFNMSKLKNLHLDENQLSGVLPSNVDYSLPNLEFISLYGNNLRGVLPGFLSKSTKLRIIQLSNNEFSGEIPDFLGELSLLQCLHLDGNNLTSQGLNFITSLTKCQNLDRLEVNNNPLNGNLPASIGNMSALRFFDASDCEIRGSIPWEIGNLSKLIGLTLANNHLSGKIPSSMKAIQDLDVSNNSFECSTLYTLCDLRSLFRLRLDHNNFSGGSIPECFGQLTSLQYLYITNTGSTFIPRTIWSLENLIELNLTANFLNGSLPPNMGNLKAATHIDLSMNQFSGEIPDVFKDMISLKYLHLDHNSFVGSIPDSLSKAVSLEELDLSCNKLSGVIPKSFETLEHMKIFNVSFNYLKGEIPQGGPFQNLGSQSFMFNEALCGDSRFNVSACPISSTNRRILLLVLIPLGITIILLAMIFIVILCKHNRKVKISSTLEPISFGKAERISYYELLEATDQFGESNFLGSGSYGSVFMGILKDGTTVAVKVFNLRLEGAFKSFETESEVLRNVRHRNLVKVISSCCVENFKALVLQYMPNGSVEKWLYSHNYLLSFMQRLNIMIDVASAIEYLHHGCSTSLVHCDLKPSNVLLDKDMIAHVADFGIAKLLSRDQSISYTGTLATMGYIAPEYGLEGQVSTRCDVYSFGIMMMEVFTRRKPSDEMFTDDLTLKQWINNATPHAVIQVVDSNLVRVDEQHYSGKLKCLASIMEVALSCTIEDPTQRSNMKDVLPTLKKVKSEFLAYCNES